MNKIIYAKFSNDRAKEFSIHTYVTKSQQGVKQIIKRADTPVAQPHIDSLNERYKKLEEQYMHTGLRINHCWSTSEGMAFEYLEGHTLELEVDQLIAQDRIQEAGARIMEIASAIQPKQHLILFQETPEFQAIFGSYPFPEQLQSLKISDIDLILGNIIVKNQEWHLIDYEWTFDFPIPVHYIVYRMLHYYIEGTAKRQGLRELHLFEKAGILPSEMAIYQEMEQRFQSYVVGNHHSMSEIYHRSGREATPIMEILDEVKRADNAKVIVYLNRGNGFQDQDSYEVKGQLVAGQYDLVIPISENIRALRVDPAECPCMVTVKQFANDKTGEELSYLHNGAVYEPGILLYNTNDPMLVLENIPAGVEAVHVVFHVSYMLEETVELLIEKNSVKNHVKKALKKKIKVK